MKPITVEGVGSVFLRGSLHLGLLLSSGKDDAAHPEP